MNNLHKLYQENMHERRVNIAPLINSVYEIENMEDEKWRQKYRLSIGVETFFWTCDKEKEEAERIAAKALMSKLYLGMFDQINMVAHAVYNNDNKKALSILADIKNDLIG